MITFATWTHMLPNSFASPWASDLSALLADANAVKGGLDLKEAVAPVKIKEPPLLFTNLGMACCATRKAPLAQTSQRS